MRAFISMERLPKPASRARCFRGVASLAICATWLSVSSLDVAEAQATPRGADPAHHGEHAAHESASSAPEIDAAELEAAFPDLGDDERRHSMHEEDPLNSLVLLDRLEVREADRAEIVDFELEAWVGRMLDRLWIRSEGRRQGGTTEHASLELLWGRGIARWWDLVAGVRRDLEPGPADSWAAFGVVGLAPYRFEVEATAYLGEGGRTAVRVEARHELSITQRLVLEPVVELEAYGSSDAARGIGSGLSSGEIGLRLRFEPRRETAPYIGIVREKKLGDTEALARAEGRTTSETRVVVGIRAWF
nr:copper resistance protein CopB [Gammaproteobacteria bacterium]